MLLCFFVTKCKYLQQLLYNNGNFDLDIFYLDNSNSGGKYSIYYWLRWSCATEKSLYRHQKAEALITGVWK